MDQHLSPERVSAYLAQLSHEMRSPLHSILGFAHMLSEVCQNHEQSEWLKHIQHAGRHLLALTNDMIDLEMLSHHAVKIADEAIDIYELVLLIKNGLQPQTMIGQLQISCEIAADCPRVWRGDQRKIKQILINLLSNAIKFTPPQGKIHVQLSKVTTGLRISVKDTGVGINTDAMSQLFTPYFHDDSAINPHGVGIGLAITRRLIELMHGNIVVNSQPKQGCEFIITLPLAPNPERPFITTKTELPPLKHSITLLLVDDDKLHHEVFHGMVNNLPIVIHSAFTGEQAVQRYQQFQPQLIVIDYRLPDTDGLTLAKTIRHHIHHATEQKPTHVVMLTAHTGNQLQAALLDGTIDALLQKPLDLTALINLANQSQLATTFNTKTTPSPIMQVDTTSPHLSLTDPLPNYLSELWNDFVQSAQAILLECQQQVATGHLTEVAHLAHQLKGQAMIFHQHSLAQLFDQLETQARLHNPQQCSTLIQQALSAYTVAGSSL